MQMVKILASIPTGLACAAFIWNRCGYDLGYEIASFTKFANLFSVGMLGFVSGILLIFIGVWKKWLSFVLLAISFLWSINSLYLKNTFFELGVRSRLEELIPNGLEVQRVDRPNHYSPWVLVMDDKESRSISKEVWIGSGRLRPWCVLVSRKISVTDSISSIPFMGFQDEWYRAEAIFRLSEGKYRLINHRGLQFIWTFNVIFED
jgi:hypothetical protein